MFSALRLCKVMSIDSGMLMLKHTDGVLFWEIKPPPSPAVAVNQYSNDLNR
jgi:hypothetical protein